MKTQELKKTCYFKKLRKEFFDDLLAFFKVHTCHNRILHKELEDKLVVDNKDVATCIVWEYVTSFVDLQTIKLLGLKEHKYLELEKEWTKKRNAVISKLNSQLNISSPTNNAAITQSPLLTSQNTNTTANSNNNTTDNSSIAPSPSTDCNNNDNNTNGITTIVESPSPNTAITDASSQPSDAPCLTTLRGDNTEFITGLTALQNSKQSTDTGTETEEPAVNKNRDKDKEKYS